MGETSKNLFQKYKPFDGKNRQMKNFYMLLAVLIAYVASDNAYEDQSYERWIEEDEMGKKDAWSGSTMLRHLHLTTFTKS